MALDSIKLEDPDQLALEWTEWLDVWRRECQPKSLPLAYGSWAESEIRLRGFLAWWKAAEDVPAKLPNALQVRTAVYLTVRSIETGEDLVGGLLNGPSS